MAKDSARLPLFVSLDLRRRTSDDIEKIKYLRNCILQSATTIAFNGWNAKNFYRSAFSGRLPLRVVFVDGSVCGDKEIDFHFASGRSATLRQALEQIESEDLCCSVLFIAIPYKQLSEFDEALRQHQIPPGTLVVRFTQDTYNFSFALACEICRWWGMTSAMFKSVKVEHFLQSVKNAVDAYCAISNETTFNAKYVDCGFHYDRVAWEEGNLFAGHADVDKIRLGARPEQVADAIKRIFDCAQLERAQHSEVDVHRAVSQGLFWLSEIAKINDVDRWLEGTQFINEVWPDNKVARPSINLRIANLSLTEFVKQLVPIPAGEYSFGSDDQSIESEPPAPPLVASLNQFRIMRSPVTLRQWLLFCSESGIAEGTSERERPQQYLDRPVTGITFFEAEAFADGLTKLLQKQHADCYFGLPTEYQWEAAARGPGGFNYPWGNDYRLHHCNCDMLVGDTTDVGYYSPEGDSPFGCVDMAGNVREWTSSYAGTRGVDWATHTKERVDREPLRISTYSRVIIKGGSYSYDPSCVQSWVRNTQIASRFDRQTGFRLVLNGE